MSAFSLFLARLGLLDNPGRRYYELDARLQTALDEVARNEQRQVGELVQEIVAGGLALHVSQQEAGRHWQTLTPREQEVTALICLGCTNRQAAAQLGVSPETIKVHIENAMDKFGVHGRGELRKLLAEWDWSAFEYPRLPGGDRA
jgi:DNA-binding CsgD family transcriptional regulator